MLLSLSSVITAFGLFKSNILVEENLPHENPIHGAESKGKKSKYKLEKISILRDFSEFDQNNEVFSNKNSKTKNNKAKESIMCIFNVSEYDGEG